MGKVSRALNKANRGITPNKDDSSPELVEDYGPTQAGRDVSTNETQTAPEPQSVKETAPTGILEQHWDERLNIATERFSPVAESFRKLRTLILHPEEESPARSILVASASDQEGKTFVCANMGVSLAKGFDSKALIMDCDLRRPTLHKLFGIDGSQGLVDYLTGERDLSRLICKTSLPNLTILPSGPAPENPSELISSDKAANLITEAIHRYDDRVVVLDTPPLLAASETIFLSQLVDKVILVVKWGKAGREEIKKVVEQIGRKKILGVVFNAFEMNILDRKVQGVGYYNYYTESYY